MRPWLVLRIARALLLLQILAMISLNALYAFKYGFDTRFPLAAQQILPPVLMASITVWACQDENAMRSRWALVLGGIGTLMGLAFLAGIVVRTLM